MKKLWLAAVAALLLTSVPHGAGAGPVWVAQDNGSGRLITSVVVTSPQQWAAGQPLTVTLTGPPGGQATFDMGPVLGVPMYEGPPGTYRGTYMLTEGDAGLVNPVVNGHLRMPNGQTSDWRPNGPPLAPIIVAVNTGGLPSLAPGQTFQITINAPPGGYASADVGPHVGIPLMEVQPGVYLGSYTVQAGDPPSAYVTGHVTVNGAPYQAAAPQPVYFTSFGGGLQVTSMTSSVTGTLYPNQTVSVTAQATPGQIASLLVNGTAYPMAEVSPGTYVANYTVPPNAYPGPAPVSVTLQDARSGRVVNQPAPFAFTVVGPRGAVPTGTVSIDSPTMRSEVQAGFAVEGRTAPGANLLVQIFLTRDEVPGGRLFDKQFETQAYAAPDGTFKVPVQLNGAASGQRLDVRVQVLDGSGSPVSRDEVVVTLR